jgi:hypothetical protein
VSSHGGIVFRVAGELWFLPATIAIKVLPVPEMATMPGAPPELRGVALVDGDMIPIVDVVEEPRASVCGAMLVCAVLGESVGLVGIEIVATGRFQAADHTEMAVKHDGEIARAFDVAAVIARVREGRWAV